MHLARFTNFCWAVESRAGVWCLCTFEAAAHLLLPHCMFSAPAVCAALSNLVPQVNKIREIPGYESIIVTHTDAPQLYVWSLERQPDRASDRVSR